MMKSKRKLEQTKQMSLGDLQPVVSKPQESTSNSTVLSLVTTKSEIVGRKPTNKNCVYEDGQWWYVGAKSRREGERQTVESHNKKNTSRMFVNGKYVSKTHPLYKAGKYKGFEEAAFSSLENYKDSAEGEVYIITNSAWPEWIKVGMAVDAEDRLKNYQTSSPFRDYVLYYSYNTDDRRKAESEAHSKLDQLFERNNEWFKCTPQEAKGVLNEH